MQDFILQECHQLWAKLEANATEMYLSSGAKEAAATLSLN